MPNPLLPISPNAYLGTVLHKMLELIVQSNVKDENDFNRLFNEQIGIIESKLQESGYGFYVPLQKNVKDFGLKKVLLKKHLRTNHEQPVKHRDTRFYSEKWFESNDKLIAGQIDLVIESGDIIEVIDFKTGAITDNILDDDGEILMEVKEEYKDQLKLYAYLYFDNTGKFPTNLSIIDLSKQKFAIDFSKEECLVVYEKAKELLNITNECVRAGHFSANPTETNCKYCLFRPSCSFFLEKLETDYSFNDVLGLVSDVVKYQNGNVSIFLQGKERCFTVTNFNEDQYEVLMANRNKRISIYNLRKSAVEFVYSATKTTMVYE